MSEQGNSSEPEEYSTDPLPDYQAMMDRANAGRQAEASRIQDPEQAEVMAHAAKLNMDMATGYDAVGQKQDDLVREGLTSKDPERAADVPGDQYLASVAKERAADYMQAADQAAEAAGHQYVRDAMEQDVARVDNPAQAEAMAHASAISEEAAAYWARQSGDENLKDAAEEHLSADRKAEQAKRAYENDDSGRVVDVETARAGAEAANRDATEAASLRTEAQDLHQQSQGAEAGPERDKLQRKAMAAEWAADGAQGNADRKAEAAMREYRRQASMDAELKGMTNGQ